MKFFKTSFIDDINLWSSRHCRSRRHSSCRHRRNRSIVERKVGRCKRQKVKHGKQKIRKTLTRRSDTFVRRSIDCECSWYDVNIDGKIKSDGEAKKNKEKGCQKSVSL